VIKGDARGAAPVNAPSPIDVGPLGKRVRWGVQVWPVNGSIIKEELYRWLRLEQPVEEGTSYPAGYCHFPKYGAEYFKQLTAEQLVPRIVKGYRRAEWQKTRDRNEALDCRVYARAAAAVCGMDRFRDAEWKALDQQLMPVAEQKQKKAPVPPAQKPPSMRTGWLDPALTRNWLGK